jgi:NTE family protein
MQCDCATYHFWKQRIVSQSPQCVSPRAPPARVRPRGVLLRHELPKRGRPYNRSLQAARASRNNTQLNTKNKLRIGIALGSGSARGWSHIGVIRALERNGIVPDIVCGTSIGALVGAALVCDELTHLEDWVRSLDWQKVVSYFDLTMSGGLIKGEKLFDFLRDNFQDRDIESLDRIFGAVATDLGSGREIWCRNGSIFDAVRASASLPGLFTPVEDDDRLLIDGGLVNPVPVSMCRELGAEIVIAVDLNADLLDKQHSHLAAAAGPEALDASNTSVVDRIQAKIADVLSFDRNDQTPSVFDVMAASINIMQVQLTRSRLAADPADVVITPRLSHLALLDFHRASDAIAEGERATQQVVTELQSLL